MSLRKLISFQYLFLAFFLAVLCSSRTNAQTESLLSARITAALKAKEPDWEYVGAIDNRFPIVPSEKRVVVGTWQAPKSRSQDVFVSVYSVENREEAAKWLQPVRDKHVAEGWHVSPFQIGDEGYLSKYKNGDRFEIEFRRGAIVAKIAGNDLDRVKEFAQCIVEQTAANPPNPMPTPDKHA
jgi:hypothetical protein